MISRISSLLNEAGCIALTRRLPVEDSNLYGFDACIIETEGRSFSKGELPRLIEQIRGKRGKVPILIGLCSYKKEDNAKEAGFDHVVSDRFYADMVRRCINIISKPPTQD